MRNSAADSSPLIDRGGAIAAKEGGAAALRAKVCMHVVGIARTEVRVMRAATALADAGLSVSIIDVQGTQAQKVEETIHHICVKHLKMPDSFVSSRLQQRTFIRAVRLFLGSVMMLIQTRADMYHAHNVAALPACYMAARLRRKPLIFEAHELPLSDLHPSEMGRSRRFMNRLLTVLVPVMVSYCAGVITVSPPIAEEMQKRYSIPEVTLLRNVPHYVAPRCIVGGDRLREHLGLGSPVRIALYQGNLQPDRGLDRLVRAAKFLEPDVVIVIMGKDMVGTLGGLEVLIEEEGVAERVKMMPPVPYEELLHWTASADIGLTIIPLDYTLNMRWALPNKFFEYLMAGLPVLSSPLDAISEMINTYKVGRIVPSLAPDDIGAAINAMLADGEGLAVMRQNALKVARAEFHWEKERQKLIRLYEDVLAKQV